MAIDLGTLQTKNNGKFVVDLEKGFKVDLEKDGKKESGFMGFSWTLLFWGFWVPLFRGRKKDFRGKPCKFLLAERKNHKNKRI